MGTARPGLCHVERIRDELEEFGGEVGKGADCRSVVEVSCRIPGCLPEGVYADSGEVAGGEFATVFFNSCVHAYPNNLVQVTSKLVSTITTFTLFQPQLSRALAKYMADPGSEGDEAKMTAKFSVLEKFESHWKYHVTVSRRFVLVKL